MTDDEFRALFDTLRQENIAAHAETRRHFDVSVERLEKRFDMLAESVASVDEKLDRKTAGLERGFRPFGRPARAL